MDEVELNGRGRGSSPPSQLNDPGEGQKMKQGKTLMELAAEVDRRSSAKRDYIAPTNELEMVPPRVAEGERESEIRINGHGSFSVSDVAHGQLAEWAGIPKRYYDLMLAEAPELHAVNVNHWLREKPARRMLRTLDGSARAFLSDRYRVIDNEEVLESILPAIAEIGDIRVESAEVTERRLYLKCLFPKVEAEVARGDIVQAGFVLSNSEIGLGSVSVDQLIFRLVCTNGMIRADSGLKKYHVGRIMGEGRDAAQFFKSDTLIADDRAFLLKLRDVVRGAAEQTKFLAAVDAMRGAKEAKIEGDPVKAIEVIAKKVSLQEGERVSVLRHLIEGGELSKYGIANAVTRASQDVDDYDRATELERIGGNIIDLDPREWKSIALAA